MLFPFPLPLIAQSHSHSNANPMRISWEWEFPFPCTPVVFVRTSGSRMNTQALNLNMFKIKLSLCKYVGLRCYVEDILSGLDNFAVGFPSKWPMEGLPVSTDSYAVCGTYSGPVDKGQVITIECAESTQQFRFVIVQSLDTQPERLCMAEVGVYVTSPRDSEF